MPKLIEIESRCGLLVRQSLCGNTLHTSKASDCISVVNEQTFQSLEGKREGKYKSGRSAGTARLMFLLEILAPQVGLEPTTLRLTAECSAIELLRNSRALHSVSGLCRARAVFITNEFGSVKEAAAMLSLPCPGNRSREVKGVSSPEN